MQNASMSGSAKFGGTMYGTAPTAKARWPSRRRKPGGYGMQARPPRRPRRAETRKAVLKGAAPKAAQARRAAPRSSSVHWLSPTGGSPGSMNTCMASARANKVPRPRHGTVRRPQSRNNDAERRLSVGHARADQHPDAAREKTTSMASTKGKDWACCAVAMAPRALSVHCVCGVTSTSLVLLADPTINEPEQVLPLEAKHGASVRAWFRMSKSESTNGASRARDCTGAPSWSSKSRPTAKARYADLQTLLDNSGWIVRRKQ